MPAKVRTLPEFHAALRAKEPILVAYGPTLVQRYYRLKFRKNLFWALCILCNAVAFGFSFLVEFLVRSEFGDFFRLGSEDMYTLGTSILFLGVGSGLAFAMAAFFNIVRKYQIYRHARGWIVLHRI